MIFATMPWYLRCYILLFYAGLISAKRNDIVGHKSASDIFDEKCSLPSKWYGSWIGIMDKSETPVTLKIINSTIDTRECKHSWDNQYLFIDLIESGDAVCWRYMFFIDQQHHNILQFKETGCLKHHGDPKNANDKLSGDSTLVTLFRADADPEPCPIRGPFTFNYSSNSGLCMSHESKADMCASSHRLRLNFESCSDLPNSHRWMDDLECFANWQDARYNYFAAKIINHQDVDETKQYRCFVYDRTTPWGTIGRSADASCRALDSIKIYFMNVNVPSIHCKFPHWLIHADHSKKKLLWTSLPIADDDRPLTYDVHRHDWIVRKENFENISTTSCISETNSNDDEFKEFVIHTTNFCDSYFSCLRLFRRNDQIVQILEGRRSPNQFVACSSENFHESKFVTLLLKDGRPTACPMRGKYAAHICREDPTLSVDGQVVVGCEDDSKMIVDYVGCTNVDDELDGQNLFQGVFYCLGDWRSGDVSYLAVSDRSRTNSKRCFIYTKQDENYLAFYDFRHFRDCTIVNNNHNERFLFNSSKIESCGKIIRSEDMIKSPDEISREQIFPANAARSRNEVRFKNLRTVAFPFLLYILMKFLTIVVE